MVVVGVGSNVFVVSDVVVVVVVCRADRRKDRIVVVGGAGGRKIVFVQSKCFNGGATSRRNVTSVLNKCFFKPDAVDFAPGHMMDDVAVLFHCR